MQLDFIAVVALNKFFNHLFLITIDLYASLLTGTSSAKKLSPIIAVKSRAVTVISSKGTVAFIQISN